VNIIFSLNYPRGKRIVTKVKDSDLDKDIILFHKSANQGATRNISLFEKKKHLFNKN